MTGLSVIKLVSGEKFLIICVLPLLYLEENTDYNVLADQLKLFEVIRTTFCYLRIYLSLTEIIN